MALAACASPPSHSGPILLVDDAGDTTALAGPAVRIVSLAPATTELLFALGAGDRVVGRTRYCDYPAEALAVPSVGEGMAPSVEAIVARAPDLVVAYRSGGNQAAVEGLRALGIPTIQLATDLLDDLDRAALTLGRALGDSSGANALVRAMADSLAAATLRVAEPPTVFILSWDQPPITLGAGSFLSQLLERAGARNLFADQPQPSFPVSLEAVASRDPDLILVTDEQEPAWASRPEWRVVPAAREKRFVRVIGSEFNRPSPRAALAVRELRRAIERAR
ncbi:MAG: ABC transporter substrate-binding protein [Gemmatimonadales bacterium]